MSEIRPTRRIFCTIAAASLASLRLPLYGQQRASTHPDVASIDHEHILADADRALKQAVTPITSLIAPRSPGTPHDFYSEPDDFYPDPASPTAPWLQKHPSPSSPVTTNPDAFVAHRYAVYQLGATVAALTAPFVISSDKLYAAKAAEHLRAWFIAPETRMAPSLQFGHRIPNNKSERLEGILDTLPLAEVARSIRFLKPSEVLTSDEFTALHAWFAEYSTWLNESRTGGLARDSKDHHGSSWLFQCAAYADANVTGLTSDDTSLDALRHRFHTVTLRAQTNALGFFPREVSAPTPYRNSLFNLDLLTLSCDLLSTRFENAWEYELQDGPGMRSAIAYHFPFILNRSEWPYPADATHFKELPGRRISLLLAGKAYSRPEYVDLWRSLKPLPDTAPPELLRTFAITQPLLWANRTKP